MGIISFITFREILWNGPGIKPDQTARFALLDLKKSGNPE
jgi:hypothetical protein